MIEPNSTVLDVGCGPSILSEGLYEKKCQIIGVDNMDIDELENPYMKSFFKWNLDTPMPLPLKDKFDYVIAADVLEHLRFSRERLISLKSCMHPESLLIASTGNIALWFYRFLLLLGRFNYTERGILDRTHVHLFTIPNFKVFIESCGYQIVETKYTPIPFELSFDWGTQEKIADAITNLYQIAARLRPTLFAYQVIIKARLAS